MNHQDWNSKVYESKNKEHTSNLANKALTDKEVKTINKPKTKGLDGKSLHKLLESESLEVPKMSHELSQAIFQARTAKNLKQKELAQMVNVKDTLISGWESGKAVPTN